MEPDADVIRSEGQPTTGRIVAECFRRVARFSGLANACGVVLVVALLGLGSVLGHRNLFTPAYLQRFALPLLAYNGSLFFLALPYLVLRALRDRDHPPQP